MRAKRASFSLWMYKSSLKMPKFVLFGQFLKTWSLRSNSVTRHVNFNITRKCQNSKMSNATFWMIFKHCDMMRMQNFKRMFFAFFLLGFTHCCKSNNKSLFTRWFRFLFFVYFLVTNWNASYTMITYVEKFLTFLPQKLFIFRLFSLTSLN